MKRIHLRRGGFGRAGTGLAVCVLLTAHCLLSLSAAGYKAGITFDEHAHLPAGVSYWMERDYRLNPEHPPLAKLVAGAGAIAAGAVWPIEDSEWAHGREWMDGGLPDEFSRENRDRLNSYYAEWWFGRAWLYAYNGHHLEGVMFGSRAAMTVLSFFLGALIWWVAARTGGACAGFVALCLYAFCPNFTGHAPLATTDVSYTLFQTLHLAALIRYFETGAGMPGRRNAFPWCVSVFGAVGALLCKYSAPAAFAVTPLFIGMFAMRAEAGARVPYVRSTLAGLVLLFVAAGVLCELFYLWLFGEHFATLWTFGFRLVRSGILKSDIYYFMGIYGKKAPLYFGAAWMLKLTLPAVILTAAGFIVALRSVRGGDRRLAALGVFIAWYYVLLAAVFPLLGVRYLFPALAPGYMLAGIAAASWWRRKWGKVLVCGFLAGHVVCSLAAWPGYIAYMNVLTASKGKAHYLGDSNLDWGENLPALKRYLDSRGVSRIRGALFGMAPPDYYGIECIELALPDLRNPREGDIVVISSRFLPDEDEEFSDALARHWELVTVIDEVYYVYEPIPGGDRGL